MSRMAANAKITAEVACQVKSGQTVFIIMQKNTKPPFGDDLAPVAHALADACVELGANPMISDIHEWVGGPACKAGDTLQPLAQAIDSADVVINAVDTVPFAQLSGERNANIKECASGERGWFVLQSHRMADWQITAPQTGGEQSEPRRSRTWGESHGL